MSDPERLTQYCVNCGNSGRDMADWKESISFRWYHFNAEKKVLSSTAHIIFSSKVLFIFKQNRWLQTCLSQWFLFGTEDYSARGWLVCLFAHHTDCLNLERGIKLRRSVDYSLVCTALGTRYTHTIMHVIMDMLQCCKLVVACILLQKQERNELTFYHKWDPL